MFDRWGHFLPGSDEDRLADINDALGDRGVRAIFTTTGGKGAYRIGHPVLATLPPRCSFMMRCRLASRC